MFRTWRDISSRSIMITEKLMCEMQKQFPLIEAYRVICDRTNNSARSNNLVVDVDIRCKDFVEVRRLHSVRENSRNQRLRQAASI
jgi:hypothetical protein